MSTRYVIERAIEDCDLALTTWVTMRDELNRDGRELERRAVVDEILDRRHQYVTELATMTGG